MRNPAFDDGVFVQSWILMDFPFGPTGQTALDYFEEFLRGTKRRRRYTRRYSPSSTLLGEAVWASIET